MMIIPLKQEYHKYMSAHMAKHHNNFEKYQVHSKEHPSSVSKSELINLKHRGINKTLQNFSYPHSPCIIVISSIHNLKLGRGLPSISSGWGSSSCLPATFGSSTTSTSSSIRFYIGCRFNLSNIPGPSPYLCRKEQNTSLER